MEIVPSIERKDPEITRMSSLKMIRCGATFKRNLTLDPFGSVKRRVVASVVTKATAITEKLIILTKPGLSL